MDLEHTFFTADQHWGHANICKYAGRPFKNVTEMDEALIAGWNEIVGPNDTVYHLGDFTLGDDPSLYFRRLNGRVVMISTPWHHDKRWLMFDVMWHTATYTIQYESPMVVIEMDKYRDGPPAIVLCHYPIAEWDRKHYGSWHLHGHSHGKYQAEGKILDVGVDSAYKLLGSYRPFRLSEVKEIMEGR